MIPYPETVAHLRNPPLQKMHVPTHRDFCQSETPNKSDKAAKILRDLCPVAFSRMAHYQATGHKEKAAVIEVMLLEHGINPRGYLSVLNDFLAAKPYRYSKKRLYGCDPDHMVILSARAKRLRGQSSFV
jgi:hypothetical protein